MAVPPAVDDVISGALFDFAGHLLTSPTFAHLSEDVRHELDQWAQARGLNLLEADVLFWETNRHSLKPQ